MQRKFLTYCLLFFIPVLLVYGFIEYLSVSLPAPFNINKERIEKEGPTIETIILGSSQMQHAVNPEWLDSPALNLASGDQHHDTDFNILKGLKERLPNLKTVVIEVSYSHFEIAHNGTDFWKNNIYLKYYGVNSFNRKTYFKDKLLFLSNPRFFSQRIERHYIEKKRLAAYNEFAFNTNAYFGQFKDLGHNEEKIKKMPRFKINTTPNLQVYEVNTALYFELLSYAETKQLEVIISTPPMYKTYHLRKHQDILRRRDSIIELSLNRYNHVTLLDTETDTIQFNVNDYWNQSHLNPKGAKKYTAILDSLLTIRN